MKNMTVTLTDEQYKKISEFILHSKLNSGEFNSFASVFRSCADEFIANHINKLVDKQMPKLPSPDTPPVVIPDTNPFASLKF